MQKLVVNSQVGTFIIKFHAADQISVTNVIDHNNQTFNDIVINKISVRVDATYFLYGEEWKYQYSQRAFIHRDFFKSTALPEKIKVILQETVENIVKKTSSLPVFKRNLKIAGLNQLKYEHNKLLEERITALKKLDEVGHSLSEIQDKITAAEYEIFEIELEQMS